MSPAEWMAALLLTWCVLSVPVGLGVSWWQQHGRGRHHENRATRARMREMRRNRVHGITLRRKK